MVYVGEYGGDEDQLIAAVLHDYIEDIDEADHADVAGRFGDRVADLVSALSDAVSKPKPPWQERKTNYLAHLRTSPADVKLISAADKLHNAQSIHRDLNTIGDEIWERFTPTKENTLWYYRGVVASLSHEWTSPLLDRLEREVRALHASAGVEYTPE
jgi:GTP pyrophosphokinase